MPSQRERELMADDVAHVLRQHVIGDDDEPLTDDWYREVAGEIVGLFERPEETQRATGADRRFSEDGWPR